MSDALDFLCGINDGFCFVFDLSMPLLIRVALSPSLLSLGVSVSVGVS